MGRSCSTHGGHEKCIQNLKEGYHSEDVGIDRRIWI
jgi:hypothetical protein